MNVKNEYDAYFELSLALYLIRIFIKVYNESLEKFNEKNI